MQPVRRTNAPCSSKTRNRRPGDGRRGERKTTFMEPKYRTLLQAMALAAAIAFIAYANQPTEMPPAAVQVAATE